MSNTIAVLLAVLIQVESGGNDKAVGDCGRAIGCLQIRVVAVDEANRIVGERRWRYSDRYDRQKSIAICRATLARHWRRGVTDPVELCCKWRNPYGKRAPLWYRERIEKALENEYVQR